MFRGVKMKDKELREKLKEIGVLDKDFDRLYAGSRLRWLLDCGYTHWLAEDAKKDVDKLKKDNEDLQCTVRALMELLNVQVIEPEKGKKLKKGNKEVSLEPKK